MALNKVNILFKITDFKNLMSGFSSVKDCFGIQLKLVRIAILIFRNRQTLAAVNAPADSAFYSPGLVSSFVEQTL